MRSKDKIVLDTETTGLLEHEVVEKNLQPHIIEIYAARLDRKNNIIDEYETFLSVPVLLEPHIIKITNIEESMLVGQPTFIEIYKNLCEIFMGVQTLIGHNISFDAGMFWIELSRLALEFNFPWPPEWYCTLEQSMYIENKRLKLSKLHEYATGEKEIVGAHRAKTDVMATLRCYKWLQEQNK